MATIHILSEYGIVCECEDDEPTIWVRQQQTFNAVSINLAKAEDRAQLRWALDQVDAIADKGDTK